MVIINELYVNRLDGCIDRDGKKYSVTRLAEKSNISRQQAHKILSGEAVPRVDTAILMCNYITELFGFEVGVSDMWQVSDMDTYFANLLKRTRKPAESEQPD